LSRDYLRDRTNKDSNIGDEVNVEEHVNKSKRTTNQILNQYLDLPNWMSIALYSYDNKEKQVLFDHDIETFLFDNILIEELTR
jgi:hypothetical protein